MPAGGSVTRGSRANGEVRRGASARIRRGRNGRATGWRNVATRKEGGVRQHDVEAEPPQEPCAAAAERLHLDARPLHHPAERHVRRADVLAGATHQAEVHEARERVVDDRRPLRDRAHRRDPPARRRRLLAGQPVGRAVRKAETARDARGEVGVGRGVPGAHPGIAPGSAPMNRTPSGSSVPSGASAVAVEGHRVYRRTLSEVSCDRGALLLHDRGDVLRADVS